VVLAVLPALAAIAVGWGPGAAAAWADSGESIRSFDARIDVDPRGDMIVTETIEYDFGPDGRHGVQRELLTRFAQPGGYEDRIYPVTDATASSPSGAPSALAVSETSSSTVLRVGDPQQTVRGRQTYVLRYTVGGAFNRLTTSTPLRDDEGGGALPPQRRAVLERHGRGVGRPDRSGDRGSGRTATGVRGAVLPRFAWVDRTLFRRRRDDLDVLDR